MGSNNGFRLTRAGHEAEKIEVDVKYYRAKNGVKMLWKVIQNRNKSNR